MKPKLLITMGCSVTEGYGCFDKDSFDYIPGKKFFEYDNFSEIFETNRVNFHSKGWPPRLQKKLKYDKLINLGLSGSSTSGQLKMFIEKFYGTNLSEKYDVLVFWLLTHQSRISFYSNGINVDILPHLTNETQKVQKFSKEYIEIGKGYLNFFKDINLDGLLEQSFYVKLMDIVCKEKGFNFLFTAMEPKYVGNERYAESFLKLFPEEPNLYSINSVDVIPDKKETEKWSILDCGHPNELGYEHVSNELYKLIKEYKSNLVNENTPTVYEYSYQGGYRNYNGQ